MVFGTPVMVQRTTLLITNAGLERAAGREALKYLFRLTVILISMAFGLTNPSTLSATRRGVPLFGMSISFIMTLILGNLPWTPRLPEQRARVPTGNLTLNR